MTDQPVWIKSVQNGTIGEARTKAFLLNRFWILERSIDIHGADFIIQRRLTNNNILDRNAPKLGVVQVKFTSTPNTTHYVPYKYVVDNDNIPRDDFFLLLHTGDEDNQKTFFLTAKDITENFEKVQEKYRIPGSIIAQRKFIIKSNKVILDLIEDQLKKADFRKNREYIAWTFPMVQISEEDILSEYTYPIHNEWGVLSEAFYEIKKSAAEALLEIEKVYSILKCITDEIDPSKTIEFLEDYRSFCMTGNGRCHISLPNDIYDEDFISVVQNHQQIIQQLISGNKLEKYIKAHKIIEDGIINFLCTHFPFQREYIHIIILKYDNDFNVSIETQSIEPSLDTRSERRANNLILMHWKPLMIIYGNKRCDNSIEQIKKNCWHFSQKCVYEVFEKILSDS